jgi:hypothetical protein
LIRYGQGELPMEAPLSDRAALIFALLVLGAAGADLVFNGGAAVFFLLLKLADFVEYLAFWR